jgi:hypothetical protein
VTATCAAAVNPKSIPWKQEKPAIFVCQHSGHHRQMPAMFGSILAPNGFRQIRSTTNVFQFIDFDDETDLAANGP